MTICYPSGGIVNTIDYLLNSNEQDSERLLYMKTLSVSSFMRFFNLLQSRQYKPTSGHVAVFIARSFLILVCVLIFVPQSSFAETSTDSFFPTWRLLNKQQKQQFIAGYLQGWKDAEKVTEITLDYVRKNPDKAVKGLESVRGLYDLSYLQPDELAHEIDDFYSDPDNHEASFSKAVTAAKQEVKALYKR